MPFEKSTEPLKDTRIVFNVEANYKKALQSLAKRLNVSLSDLIREAIAEKFENKLKLF